MLAMVPITNIALGTLPPERMKNASGLFNLTRNLGGAFGLAVLTTALRQLALRTRRESVVMAFADVFLILTALFVALALLAAVMKRPGLAAAGGQGAGDAH